MDNKPLGNGTWVKITLLDTQEVNKHSAQIKGVQIEADGVSNSSVIAGILLGGFESMATGFLAKHPENCRDCGVVRFYTDILLDLEQARRKYKDVLYD